MILSHDGQILSGPTQLYDQQTSPNCWSKPGVVHDFDGDGHPDISDSSCGHVSVYHVNPNTFGITTNWTPMVVDDTSGLASSTAFDFSDAESPTVCTAIKTTCGCSMARQASSS